MTKEELLAELADIGRLPNDEELGRLDDSVANALLNRYAATVQELYPLSDESCIRPILQSVGYGHAYGIYDDALTILLAQEGQKLETELIRSLASTEPGERKLAAEALRYVGGASTLTPLLDALSDPHPLVREHAAAALGERDDDRAEAALVRALRDPHADVRVAASLALDRLVGERPTLKRATLELELALHDLVAASGGAGETKTILLDVETLQEGDTVAGYFLREQRTVIERYVARFREVGDAPQIAPIERTLVLDIRHTSQSQAEALQDLARALRTDGTLYAPDGRGLWDKVCFLEGDDVDPQLSTPVPIP